MYEGHLVRCFVKWVTNTFHMIEEERWRSAQVLQRAFRGLSDRMLRSALENQIEEKRKGKYRFRFLRTDAEKAKGITTDGKLYFATLKECEAYIVVWKEMAQKTVDYMLKCIKSDRQVQPPPPVLLSCCMLPLFDCDFRF
jgi:hypothetical protein